MNSSCRAIALGVCLSCLALVACDSVRFAKVELPNMSAFSAKLPSAPDPHPVTLADGELKWQIVDASAKAPLRKKTVGVQVAAGHGDGEQLQRAARTSQLMARLMTGGFASLIDLSCAPHVNAEVTRGGAGNSVVLSGPLHQVLPVASPLRADYVLSVSFAALPAARSSKQIRYSIGDQDMQAYREDYDRYQGELRKYLQGLDSAWQSYESAFQRSKEEYDKSKGRYATFPSPTEGQRAVTEHDRLEGEYRRFRAAAESARSQAVSPEDWSKSVAGRKDTEAHSQTRLLAWASVQEAMSNRVVWIAWVDQPVADPDSGVTALLDRLVSSLPNDSRGAR